MTYLSSDFANLGQSSIAFSAFFNIQLENSTRYGKQITNRLAVFSLRSDTEGIFENVYIKNIENDYSSNLLEEVNDAIILQDWKSDTDYSQLLFMMDQRY
jgi:hypothetical protein